tara:strand:- start:330 stop:524 length:195 start_codon:yes stop_codon:yes gene_type:complete
MCQGIHRTPLVALPKILVFFSKRVDLLCLADQLSKNSPALPENLVELTGIEPATSGLQSPRSPS